MKIKTQRKIWVLSNTFNYHLNYRFEYETIHKINRPNNASWFRRRNTLEGEHIVYNVPVGVTKLKIGSYYYDFDKLNDKPHHLKAKAIKELLKRREQKWFYKKEGKPTFLLYFKNQPKKKRNKKTHK